MRPGFLEWLRSELGTQNWVVARRTKRILAKYGDDVRTISPLGYRKLIEKYRAEFHEAAEKYFGS